MDKRELLRELVSRGSYLALADSINQGELDDFQTVALAYGLITKGCIISLDTGLGKTYVASAYMNCIRKKHPEYKFIWVCENYSINQNKEAIERLTGMDVAVLTGKWNDIKRVLYKGNALKHDVYMVTYEGLRDLDVGLFFIENNHIIKNIVFDESHMLGNPGSTLSRIVKAMCKSMEYKLFLTATPATKHPEQTLNQIAMLDKTLVDSKVINSFLVKDRRNGEVKGYKNLEKLVPMIMYNYFSMTREDLGLDGSYDIMLHLCQPTLEQRSATARDSLNIIRGNPEGEQVKKLLEYINHNLFKKGLIYINTNKNKLMVKEVLTNAGISVGILDGTFCKDKNKTIEMYNNNEYQVLITNLKTSINLESDFIYFYEMTLHWKQVVGRGQRGLEKRNLDLIWSITEDTYEVDYFIENIYKRSVLLKEGLGKNTEFIEKVKSLIDKLQ